MPRNNFIHVRGEVVGRPYFDTVPNRQTNERIAFFKVLLDCPRDESQPRDERHEVDRIRVVAYGKLAEALRGRVKHGDWLVVSGWVQIRAREDAAERSMSLTMAEVIAMEVDHFMHPFVPGSDLMNRYEQLAEMRGESVREILTRVMTVALVQMESDGQMMVQAVPHVDGNGAHG